MANYTQYIPQVNSTTYPTSINNCFTALTADVTSIENEITSARNGEANLLDGINLKLNLTGGTLTGALTLSGNPTVDLHAVPRQYVTANYLPLTGGTLSGTLIIGTDTVAVKDAALTNTYVVSADVNGRITTTSGIVAANVVERSGTLTSGDIAVVTSNNDIQTTGLVATNIATLSGTQTLTGNKTFSGTNTISGVNNFTAIPAFNGGTSGVSAPFTVDSTQVVTNFNADLLDGAQGSLYARLASPTFSGNPILPTGTTGITQTDSDNSTKLATTEYVENAKPVFRGCYVKRATTFAIGDTSYTGVEWDAEDYDTDTIHDLVSSPDQFDIPTGVTKIRCTAEIRWAGSTTTGYRNADIVVAGTLRSKGYEQGTTTWAGAVTQKLDTGVIQVADTDIVILNADQTSGSSLNISIGSWFCLEVIE